MERRADVDSDMSVKYKFMNNSELHMDVQSKLESLEGSIEALKV